MKKLSNVLIALILLLSMALPFNTEFVSAQSFSDVPTTHSNYEDITYLLDEGVIDQSNKFGVSDIVTREDVAVMVAKAVGLDGTPRGTKFSDVPKLNKNSGYIQSAVEAGIINGYDDGTFKPNAKVTRGHMAAFISRAFDLPSGTKSFSDVKKGHTAYEAVSQLAAAGITTGYEDGTFKPSNNLTRAHIAAFLARAMKLGITVGETIPTAPTPIPVPVPQPESKFNNCEELTKFYPEGVMAGHTAYDSKLDRDGDGHACELYEDDSYTPPAITPTPVPTPQPTPEPVQTGFKNCTELRNVYPEGVSSSHPAYQSKMDRDGDGYACE